MTEIAVPPVAPAPVKRAVLCLWLSWFVGFVRAPIQLQDPETKQKIQDSLAMAQAMQPSQDVDPEAVEALATTILYSAIGIGFAISLGITTLILHKLKKGRDWARILCLIWGAISALGFFKLDGLDLSTGLTIASLALGYYALYLLFTEPGAVWFRKKSATAEAADAKW
ncbi:MAG: hypothetical protein KBA75_05110 [Alphaproteobacteria bacterium]|nr:hypothetical protein [Alphaproteobacteria bacterium]